MKQSLIISVLFLGVFFKLSGQSQELGIGLALENSPNSVFSNPTSKSILEEHSTLESNIDRTVAFYFNKYMGGTGRSWTLVAFEGLFGTQLSEFTDTAGRKYWSPSQNDTLQKDLKYLESSSQSIYVSWTPSYYMNLFDVGNWNTGPVLRGLVGIGYRFNHIYKAQTILPDGSTMPPVDLSSNFSDYIDLRIGIAPGYRFIVPFPNSLSAFISIELPVSVSYGIWIKESQNTDLALNLGYIRVRLGIAF